jgi:hypothetical protein
MVETVRTSSWTRLSSLSPLNKRGGGDCDYCGIRKDLCNGVELPRARDLTEMAPQLLCQARTFTRAYGDKSLQNFEFIYLPQRYVQTVDRRNYMCRHTYRSKCCCSSSRPDFSRNQMQAVQNVRQLSHSKQSNVHPFTQPPTAFLSNNRS